MSNIVEVQFQDDRLQATREGEQVWVVVKRVCEALGLQPHGQAEKLKEKPWAVTQFICATGPDGKNYDVFALDLDSLPMWLATIEVSRVRPEARDKLIAYQRECARVLRDHFFGRGIQQLDVEALVSSAVERAVPAILERALPIILNAVDARVDARLAKHSAGFAGPWEVAKVRRRVHHAAKLSVAGKAYPTRRAALSGIWHRVRTACNWNGKLQHFPAWALPDAEQALDAIDRELGRSMNVRQLSLG